MNIFNEQSMLAIHLVLASIMVGVIWVIQLVHYPSFRFTDREKYVSFQIFHMRKISFIVMPVMVLEFLSGLLLVLYHSNYESLLRILLIFSSSSKKIGVALSDLISFIFSSNLVVQNTCQFFFKKFWHTNFAV